VIDSSLEQPAAGRHLRSFALLFLVYSAAAAAGLQWATVNGAASPIWPAAGIGLAGLLIGGRALWPAIAVGVIVSSQLTGAAFPWWAQLAIGCGNAGATVVAATLIKRSSGIHFNQLGTIRDVLLLLAAAVVTGVIAAAVGAAALFAADVLPAADLPQVLLTWFFGDLILTTLARTETQLTFGAAAHLGIVLLACGLLSWLIFFGASSPRAWAIFPALIWGALAFRALGASLALLVVVAMASAGTLLGSGPFASAEGGVADLITLQQYLAVTAVTVLLLAAAVDERNTEMRLRGIADREMAARRLAAATEERLQLAMEASSTGMWSWEVAEDRVDWSDECYRIHDLEPGTFAGTSQAFDALIHPDDRNRVWSRMNTCLSEGTDLEIEFRIVRPSGELRWIVNHGRPIHEDGRAVRVIGTINDITQRKLAEQERADLLRRAEVAQRAARSSLYELDVRTQEVIRDPYLRELAGYSIEQLPDTHAAWEAIILPEDLDEFRNTVDQAMNRAERYAMEYRIRAKDGGNMWISDVGQILRSPDGTAERIVGLASDVTERKQAEDELRLRTAELETLVESAPIGLAYFDREHRWLRINELLAEINGYPVADHIGCRLEDLLPVNAVTVGPILDRIFTTGEAVGNLEIKGETPAQPGLERHWLAGFFPVLSGGSVSAVGAWVIEISERKAAEEREQLLAREVDHRAKNLLTVVQSVVQMTRADDPEQFRAGVTGRIQSLARAHGLLASSRWQGVELTQLARDELAPYLTEDGSRVTVEGPPLRLSPAAGQSLAMVLHELATNAAKYGSLSHPEGRLRLIWSREEGGGRGVRLLWCEENGRAAIPPSRSGFGSRLIRASVERQLSGELAYHWGEDGLTVQLLLPDSHFHALAPADMKTEQPAPPAEPEPPQPRSAGCRVLLVEDEALIGMELEEALQAAGCTVIGVAATVAEALDMIERNEPQGALLDINLAGEDSYPVADRLVQARIPFAFCSGYAADAMLPERFAGVPLIRKPFNAASVVDLFKQELETR
jgi:PAS domain S-box-containing protein